MVLSLRARYPPRFEGSGGCRAGWVGIIRLKEYVVGHWWCVVYGLFLVDIILYKK
jgi:hypothetical protein